MSFFAPVKSGEGPPKQICALMRTTHSTYMSEFVCFTLCVTVTALQCGQMAPPCRNTDAVAGPAYVAR